MYTCMYSHTRVGSLLTRAANLSDYHKVATLTARAFLTQFSRWLLHRRHQVEVSTTILMVGY